VLSELVSEHQNAFIQGGEISDSMLLAHKLVRDFNSPMGLCLMVDLHKAFNNVNGEFVYFIMHCIGFHKKWIN